MPFDLNVTHAEILAALEEEGPMTSAEVFRYFEERRADGQVTSYTMVRRRLDSMRASGLVVRSDSDRTWSPVSADYQAVARARRMDNHAVHGGGYGYHYLEPDDVLDVLRDNGRMTAMDIVAFYRDEPVGPYANVVRSRLVRLQAQGRVRVVEGGRGRRGRLWEAVE